MTDTFRALLLELVETWDSFSYADAGDATDRMSEAVKEARAALAEPEQLQRPDCFEFGMDFLGDPEAPAIRAYVESLEKRAALAETEPPADGEVAELVAELRNRDRWTQLTDAQVDRAADLLERLAVPEPVGPTDEALANFTAWFCRSYPGPDTIIHKPEWHAPRVLRAAAHALARWGRP